MTARCSSSSHCRGVPTNHSTGPATPRIARTSQARFPQPAQLFAALAAQGYKVIFWSTPYVGKTAANAIDRAEGRREPLLRHR